MDNNLILLFIVWYKKTLKSTGKPLVIKDMITGQLKLSDRFEMKNIDVRMVFENTRDEAKVCGATTVLEVWGTKEQYDLFISQQDKAY
jgi:hypothetical protein